jgi:hypothetical protein
MCVLLARGLRLGRGGEACNGECLGTHGEQYGFEEEPCGGVGAKEWCGESFECGDDLLEEASGVSDRGAPSLEGPSHLEWGEKLF